MDLRPRDLAILRHVALYRLTLPIVIQRQYCAEGKTDPTTILNKLAKLGLLRPHTKVTDGALPGRIAFYTLTPEGARAVSAPKDRAEPLGPASLRSHLAILWFCFLSDRRRFRLEPEELRELFGDRAPHANIACCITEEEDGPRVYRVYGTATDRAKTMKQLRSNIAKAWETPELRPWLDAGDLAFAILGETRPKCADLQKALQPDRREGASPRNDCHVIVRFAPGPAGVKKALDDLGKGDK